MNGESADRIVGHLSSARDWYLSAEERIALNGEDMDALAEGDQALKELERLVKEKLPVPIDIPLYIRTGVLEVMRFQ